MTSMHHHARQFPTEMGSCKLFYPSWPGTSILPVLVSQVIWATLPNSP
jgi:hypothetical protein